MFCRIGVKLCHVLRKLSKVLCTWLSAIDSAHDRLYCCCCEPTYVTMTNCPQKGEFLNESEC